MRRLIIDGQILQTTAWYRGMGKYLVELLRELNKHVSNDFELTLMFNESLEMGQERLDTLHHICPNIGHVFFELPITHGQPTGSKFYKKKLGRQIKKHFKGSDNYFLITSLFFFDFYAEFPKECKKLLLIYDLIPFLFWQELGELFPAVHYMARFKTIFEADQIFAISGTTKKDLMSALGLPDEKITNINGGFSKTGGALSKPSGLKLPKRYILFPSGDLPHKNNEVAIKGFEAYRQQYDKDVALIVTSSFSESSVGKLKALSPNVIFTGHVIDSELNWLYLNAVAVLFASLHEGLGLPVLDAVAYNKPIIASRVSTFEEMATGAFYYFDSYDSSDLARAIQLALSNEGLIDKTNNYPKILRKYTWDNTCNSFLQGLDAAQGANTTLSPNKTKPKIALACIHPRLPGQIGRGSETLYGMLNKMFEIDFYFDFGGHTLGESDRPTFLEYLNLRIFSIERLNVYTYKKYETIIYLIDDMSLPSRMAQRAVALPGSTVVAKAATDKLFGRLIVESSLKVYETTPTINIKEFRNIAESIRHLAEK